MIQNSRVWFAFAALILLSTSSGCANFGPKSDEPLPNGPSAQSTNITSATNVATLRKAHTRLPHEVDGPSQMTTSTVFDSADWFANELLIVGQHGAYYFSPGAIVTYDSPYILVRAYDSLFIYNVSNVLQMRYMSQSSSATINSSTLPEETDPTLVSQLANSPPVSAGSELCTDCAFPVDAGYLGTSTVATPPPFLAPTAPCTPNTGNCNYPDNPVPDGTYATSSAEEAVHIAAPLTQHVVAHPRLGSATAHNCLPSNWTYDATLDACVQPAQSNAASIRPRIVFGTDHWSYKYLWALSTGQTGLYFNVPDPWWEQVIGYEYSYGNFYGQYVNPTFGAKQFVPPLHWRLVVTNTQTWLSTTSLLFYDIVPSGRFGKIISVNIGSVADVVSTLPNM